MMSFMYSTEYIDQWIDYNILFKFRTPEQKSRDILGILLILCLYWARIAADYRHEQCIWNPGAHFCQLNL